MLLAHREVDDEGNIFEQSLEEHIYATAKRAGEIGRLVHMESLMRLTGLLHDCGKADRNFQDHICVSTNMQVNHSSAGGRVLHDLLQTESEFIALQNKNILQYFEEVLTYIILAHHGLYDLVPYGNSIHKTQQRLDYDQEADYHYQEDVMEFVRHMNQQLVDHGNTSLVGLIKEAYQEFEIIYSKLKQLANKNVVKEKRIREREYYLSCLTRLGLSILKEADIYDSANAFHSPKQQLWAEHEVEQIWEDASKKVEDMYHMYESSPNPSEINQYRNEIASSAKNAAMTVENGIFQLNLPTGAGKTKAGLRYALTNARKYKRNRIFYITAYLSVLEQNAVEIRHILNMDDVILEHHSNAIREKENQLEDKEKEEDDREYKHQAYLKESWENPIILTTMVQFFHTLYKEKASNIRRFCKLINAVIIMDEIQSLPLKVGSNFNLMMNFMKEIMHCNIVHCTATQPFLDSEVMYYPVHYGDEIGAHTQIVELGRERMDCFERVEFYNLTGDNARTYLSTKELTAHIQEQLRLFDSCLVVLNTKKAVEKLCDFMEEEHPEVEVVYLTTNQCAANRLDIIAQLKTKLLQNRNEKTHHKLICISTQLVEAGVDLDFDVVFRSMAGIDSIIQCAGRDVTGRENFVSMIIEQRAGY